MKATPLVRTLQGTCQIQSVLEANLLTIHKHLTKVFGKQWSTKQGVMAPGEPGGQDLGPNPFMNWGVNKVLLNYKTG